MGLGFRVTGLDGLESLELNASISFACSGKLRVPSKSVGIWGAIMGIRLHHHPGVACKKLGFRLGPHGLKVLKGTPGHAYRITHNVVRQGCERTMP